MDGWVQVSRNFFEGILIFWSSIPLLQVVSYDLNVLSMLVMRLQNKKFGRGWVGGVSSIQFYFGFFNFAKPLIQNKQFTITKYYPNYTDDRGTMRVRHEVDVITVDVTERAPWRGSSGRRGQRCCFLRRPS